MRVLNITNGDGAANTIKQSAVGGDVLAWRDPMHHGPFPENLTLPELAKVRAQYLAGPGGDASEVERDFDLRDGHLGAAQGYDRVVLWFEHDLLDQLQILQILDWFAAAGLDHTELEMICVNSFPGKPGFRGIGELTPAEAATLVTHQRPVTAPMLALAVAGWAAFRSDTPEDLVGFLRGDLSAMPFLEAALRRHLEEYPDATTGVTRTEAQLLRLMGEGVHGARVLFARNMDAETALFIGDWGTYRILERLCNAGLAACDPGPFRYPSFDRDAPDDFDAQRLSLTEMGRKVMTGDQHAFGVMPRDGLLGGVELARQGKVWTWDRTAARVLRRAI
ncbi:MAG: hypothetical protein AAGL23_10235 [Pseudomonadota bacterium]